MTSTQKIAHNKYNEYLNAHPKEREEKLTEAVQAITVAYSGIDQFLEARTEMLKEVS